MPSRSKQGIYENVYEIVGLAGREKERAKDIHETRMLCSNPSKWEDWLRGCFISRIVSRYFFYFSTIAFAFYFSSRFSSIYFFLLLIACFTHDCSSCSLLRLTSIYIIFIKFKTTDWNSPVDQFTVNQSRTWRLSSLKSERSVIHSDSQPSA